MKIYIFSFTFYPDVNGVANVARKHADYFKSLGHEVHVVTKKNLNRSIETKELYLIDDFEVDGNSHIYNFYRGEINTYVQFLENLDCDIAFFHCWQIWSTDLFFLTKKSKINYKTILVSHCTGVNTIKSLRDKINFILFLPYRIVMNNLMKRFDKIVTLSDLADNDRFYDIKMLKRLGLSDKKVVIPNGTDIIVANYDEHDIISKGLEKNKYIIYVSNYQPIKNQKLAIDIFINLRTDYKLVLIGSSKSEYYYELMEYVSTLENGNNILMLHSLRMEETHSLKYFSKLSIFTSNSECMPLTVLESISMGKPVISTRVGNVASMGGVVCSDSAEGLSNLLQTVLNDNKVFLQLEQDAISYAKNHTWDAIMQKYNQLIEKL